MHFFPLISICWCYLLAAFNLIRINRNANQLDEEKSNNIYITNKQTKKESIHMYKGIYLF